MLVFPGKAPLHCLSRTSMTRTTSEVLALVVLAGKSMAYRQLMLLIVHFRPMRCTSVVPWAMLLIMP